MTEQEKKALENLEGRLQRVHDTLKTVLGETEAVSRLDMCITGLNVILYQPDVINHPDKISKPHPNNAGYGKNTDYVGGNGSLPLTRDNY